MSAPTQMDSFRMLYGDLMRRRKKAGGRLTQEEENEYASALADLWDELREDERAILEDEA